MQASRLLLGCSLTWLPSRFACSDFGKAAQVKSFNGSKVVIRRSDGAQVHQNNCTWCLAVVVGFCCCICCRSSCICCRCRCCSCCCLTTCLPYSTPLSSIHQLTLASAQCPLTCSRVPVPQAGALPDQQLPNQQLPPPQLPLPQLPSLAAASPAAASPAAAYPAAA